MDGDRGFPAILIHWQLCGTGSKVIFLGYLKNGTEIRAARGQNELVRFQIDALTREGNVRQFFTVLHTFKFVEHIFVEIVPFQSVVFALHFCTVALYKNETNRR